MQNFEMLWPNCIAAAAAGAQQKPAVIKAYI